MDSLENMEDQLNYNSLEEFIKRQYPDRHIVFDVHPTMLNDLHAELINRDYKTLSGIKKTLLRTIKAVELYEVEYPPSKLEGSHLSGLGVIRLSMLLVDDAFFTTEPSVLGDTELRNRLTKYRQYVLPKDAV